MSKSHSKLDVLFINPRDLVGALPYVKSLPHAALLRDHNIKVDLIDPAASKLSHKKITNIISKRQPLIVVISAFPSTLPDAYQTVQLIKHNFPNIYIVVEGYHVNADASIILEMNADYGLTGDSEYTLLELCKSILNKVEINEKALGLAINKNGQLIENKPAVVNDINQLPIPAFDLMPIGKYYSASTDKRFVHVFLARGCPYDCYFCASPAQRNYRPLTLENKLKYVDYLVNKLNIQWIEFMDLTFTISKKQTIEFCQAIVNSGIQFDWGCETRADLVDEEILIAMKAAGCNKITFGVEAGNDELRSKSGKKITKEVFLNVFEICKRHGIKTMANFIIGHPGETEEQILESIKFAKDLKPFNVFFTRMMPLPDVDIFKNGVKNGEVDPDVWVKYMKGETEHPVYVTPTIEKEKLTQLYSRAYREFYFRWYSIKNYLPLFLNIRFLFRSIGIFNRIVFGAPVFK